jgi:hypothetical protein
MASSNETSSVEKALDGDAVLIMPDQWRETVREAEMGDSAGVKVIKHFHISISRIQKLFEHVL